MKVRITLWPLQGNLRRVNATELGSTCCHWLIVLGLVMSVRSGFPSRSASSYSCITARVDITAAATGELESTCDLAAMAQADGASKANINLSHVIILPFGVFLCFLIAFH